MEKQLIAQANEKHSQNKKDNLTECFSVGAEAKIYKEGNKIIKDRISKGYRHPELDKKIIKQRTKREAKLLAKASSIINAPIPENLNETEKSRTNKIIMPYVEGKKLSKTLENLDWKNICKLIGNQIAKLHDADIIHGDLTTSNMIYVESESYEKSSNAELKTPTMSKKKLLHEAASYKKSNTIINKIKKEVAEQEEANSKLYFIDFGLSFESKKIEDKAVDLHLIKQALEAKHFSIHKEAEKIILDNYNSKDKEKVLKQLEKVELRGRYKH